MVTKYTPYPLFVFLHWARISNRTWRSESLRVPRSIYSVAKCLLVYFNLAPDHEDPSELFWTTARHVQLTIRDAQVHSRSSSHVSVGAERQIWAHGRRNVTISYL
jgi:hypothetical protein